MELNIEINCESDKWKGFLADAELILNDLANKALEEIGVSNSVEYVEISVLLTDNNNIRKLNRDYRGKDKPTNVLSFPLEEHDAGNYNSVAEQMLLGDIALAYEIILQEANEQEKSFKHHYTHLVLHGILHLLGYDHIEEDDAEEMESIEINVLEKMEVANPY